jgi:DNA-binding transcriptional ArsR family regulator
MDRSIDQLGRLLLVAEALAGRARLRMLLALEEEGELSVTDLAGVAGSAVPTASRHLDRLIAAGLVAVRAEGRHRFFRLARPDILEKLRGCAGRSGPSATDSRVSRRPGHHPLAGFPVDARTARTCYDHLAGRLGVALTDHLLRRRWIAWKDASHDALALTASGTRALRDIGVIGGLRATHRARIRPCLDGTERRPHVAGAVGATLADLAFDRRWVLRTRRSRALEITPVGERGFAEVFGLDLETAGLRGRVGPSV